MYTVSFFEGVNNVGCGYEEFIDLFEDICNEHLQSGKARAFGFIFYDMRNGNVRNALENAAGYQLLNQAAGKDITVFYIHSKQSRGRVDEFNKHFLHALNVADDVSAPCIVFFQVSGNDIEEVRFQKISEKLPTHLVAEELRREITAYIDDLNKQGDLEPAKWAVVSVVTFVLRQALKML